MGNLLNFKAHTSYIILCVTIGTQLFMESQKDTFFVRVYEYLCGTPLNSSKKSVIIDHILLKGHDACFDDFTNSLKENI